MMLGNLVNQLIAKEEPSKITQRTQLCPTCQERERTRNNVTGKLTANCKPCAVEYNKKRLEKSQEPHPHVHYME